MPVSSSGPKSLVSDPRSRSSPSTARDPHQPLLHRPRQHKQNSSCSSCKAQESDSSKETLARLLDHLSSGGGHKNMNRNDDEDDVQSSSLSHGYPHQLSSCVNAIWSSAMSRPNDPDLVELGVFHCMASLIWKGLRNRKWLLRDHNIRIPYYAAHVIGSYSMNRTDFAAVAVSQGVIPPLVELLRGRMTWVEQRVAVRALGHIAAFDDMFSAIADQVEILELSIELALNALEIVYTQFVRSEDTRLKYHRDLLTRGTTGHPHIESRKAEEWASQLQCWSLQLINCFAMRKKYLSVICRPDFLARLPGMWGGLMNENSPAGMGLLLSICRHKVGRRHIAAAPSIVQALCNVSRSSDDWQYMAVDCLLLLLQDSHTRRWVFNDAIVPLVDLAVQPCLGERKRLGTYIVDILLHQGTLSPMHCSLSSQTQFLLDELINQRQRWKWEKSMPKGDLHVKQQAAHVIKLEGNAKFAVGDIVEAVYKYTEALSLCPLRAYKERVVLYSNRAQCYLLLRNPEAAISDTTRALCLHKPTNGHGRSLWRRSQAYEMLGFSKESLLDAIMFVNECSNAAGDGKGVAVPDYAQRLIQKQMKETWLFVEAARRHGDLEEMQGDQSETKEDYEEEDGEQSEWETASESDATLANDTTDQELCNSKDDFETDDQPDNRKVQHNLQKLLSSLKDVDLGKSSSENNYSLRGTHEKKNPEDKDLLKKQIYNLIQDRWLINLQKAKG